MRSSDQTELCVGQSASLWAGRDRKGVWQDRTLELWIWEGGGSVLRAGGWRLSGAARRLSAGAEGLGGSVCARVCRFVCERVDTLPDWRSLTPQQTETQERRNQAETAD
ncbi:hypothetical protein MATL_G00161980 [Megalops atlanticus]|uniref:Uncharacterized protein n=1 Tax=Megalops atlanticus TaxID=7932 RepID=A0A9D3PTE3_MEGAT|nr:hypothetical protein MATL_G00161980 [Megalops atlanticus]